MRAAVFAAALGLWPSAALACSATDWLSVPLPSSDFIETALETAYPGSDLDLRAGVFTAPNGQRVPFEAARDVTASERLNNATLGDMFVYVYPLTFDLEARRQAWHDPGRVRNDALFRALYFASEQEARVTLRRVDFVGANRTASFQVTTAQCADVQLKAALAEIAALGPVMDRYFETIGGSFNWRVISGTKRLSAHSFGIAVDFNSQLGGYWRWSGAKPGEASDFTNRYPPELVAAMERYGFIWGGKWHHFDGMHFEYRPELILFARLIGGG